MKDFKRDYLTLNVKCNWSNCKLNNCYASQHHYVNSAKLIGFIYIPLCSCKTTISAVEVFMQY